MKTTLNHLGKLTLCLLCAVAMIVPSINMAAATPANKAKTTKVKKSKKRGKGKKRSTKKTELTIIPTQEVVEVPINVDVQIDDRYGTEDMTPDIKVEAAKESYRDEPKPEPKPQKDEVFTSAAVMPIFPGGQSAMMKYISMNLHYPEKAQDNGIQGKVVVQFIVEKDGSVGEVKIARGVDKDLDREAVRVCKSLPKFSPGRNASGDPIRVWYTLPVTFKLTQPATDEESSQ